MELPFVNICINDRAAPAPSVLMQFTVDIKLQGVRNIVEGKEIISGSTTGWKYPGELRRCKRRSSRGHGAGAGRRKSRRGRGEQAGCCSALPLLLPEGSHHPLLVSG